MDTEYSVINHTTDDRIFGINTNDPGLRIPLVGEHIKIPDTNIYGKVEFVVSEIIYLGSRVAGQRISVRISLTKKLEK